MKTIYSSVAVLLATLVVAQTASAIPTLTTEADFSVLNTPSVTNEYTGPRWYATEYTGPRWHATDYAGSRLHATFRSIRDFAEKYIAGNVKNETALMGIDSSFATNHDDFFAKDDSSYKKDKVDVPEPSLVALIAIGLVGFGLFSRKKNY